MSSETIVTAIFLITAVVAAGILTSQIFPAIYTMSGTVSSSAHAADQSMRTDITIVNTYANTSNYAQVWVKNVGSSQISLANLNATDIWVNYVLLPRNDLSSDGWTFDIPGNTNSYWDPMETVHITMRSSQIPTSSGGDVQFQMALYDGTKRSAEFTVS
jgi:flagellar protein FlaG